MDRAKIPGIVAGQRHPNWTALYENAQEVSLPWYFGRLDSDIETELLKEKNPALKSVLDIGAGLGNQAALIAGLGFNVTATDISPFAMQRAQEKYPNVKCIVDDISQSKLSTQYNYIVDRGCFHILDIENQATYIQKVKELLLPGGTLLLKVLNSEMGPADFGPVRFSLKRLHYLFSTDFEILKIRRSQFFGSTEKAPAAWFMVMKGKENA